jgi:hypothetical protein
MAGKPRNPLKPSNKARAATRGGAASNPASTDASPGINDTARTSTPFQRMQQLLATRAVDAQLPVPVVDTVEGTDR